MRQKWVKQVNLNMCGKGRAGLQRQAEPAGETNSSSALQLRRVRQYAGVYSGWKAERLLLYCLPVWGELKRSVSVPRAEAALRLHTHCKDPRVCKFVLQTKTCWSFDWEKERIYTHTYCIRAPDKTIPCIEAAQYPSAEKDDWVQWRSDSIQNV